MISKDQIQQARKADLYTFLLQHYPDTVEEAGHARLRHKAHGSLVITQGKGWVHNSKSESGNSIDYLKQYLGYSFENAVGILLTEHYTGEPFVHKRVLIRPQPIQRMYKRMFAYLKYRGLSDKVIQALVKDKLIFEEAEHHNICFAVDDFIETHGSLTDRVYKGIVSGSASNGFWHFGIGTNTAYVCESAIDAMSLYDLQALSRNLKPCVYCSMAGLKQATLIRIKSQYNNVILAVDNDEAGNKFANDNSELERILPNQKDWNEDLQCITSQKNVSQVCGK